MIRAGAGRILGPRDGAPVSQDCRGSGALAEALRSARAAPRLGYRAGKRAYPTLSARMRPWSAALPIACLASSVAWASYAAWKVNGRGGYFALRALLGGAAAFGLATTAYDLAELAGIRVEWDRLARGELPAAALLAAAIGIVEEGAKLVGLLLVIERGWRGRAVLAAAVGVAAGFAALETFTTLYGSGSPAALARAALGPAAHALLALPLAVGAAAAARRGKRAWPQVALGLAASAALHGAGDLSLVLPRAGRVGYALALLVPTLWLFARARRPASPALDAALR